MPTEAEWEVACRGSKGTTYAWGNSDSASKAKEYAWFSANSGNAPHPVASLKANSFGLFDMHGNAREWCAVWFTEPYIYTGSQTDPVGATEAQSLAWNRSELGTGPCHSVKGGDFSTPVAWLAADERFAHEVDERSPWVGFRVVMDVSVPVAPPAKAP